MSTGFVFLTSANLSSFASLYVDVFNRPPWNDGWTKQAAIDRLSVFISMPRFCGLGLTHGDDVRALAMGWAERWVDGWHFHLKEMCVASDLRRQGIGARLLARLECEVAQQGCTRIFLETGQEGAARRFYEANGYAGLALVSLTKPLAPS